MPRPHALLALAALLMLTLVPNPCRAGSEPIELWPSGAPGPQEKLPPEALDHSDDASLVAGKTVERLGNVSAPTLTLFRAAPSKDTGATVLVCPGGGYYILALDLEGTEVCEWLNSIGVNAALLKYRVPRREGLPPHAAPLQDAQRAFGILRSLAPGLGLDPHRMGVLGFSAGAHLCAALCNNHAQRTYPGVDASDSASCRPDFCVLIYPAYLTAGDKFETVAPELAVSREQTPSTFIAMTEDDPIGVGNALCYYAALAKAGVPAEMHLYAQGGHGYGMRRTKLLVTTWPERVADWLKAGGWLDSQTRK